MLRVMSKTSPLYSQSNESTNVKLTKHANSQYRIGPESRQWRMIDDCPTSGRRNMAVDEAILEAVSVGERPPTLRLYAWNPACLSLGYGQKIADVDVDRLRLQGWDIVRRPTGGRAILHADQFSELTYSVALPIDHPLAQGGVLESYRRISLALLAVLNQLGVAVNADRREGRIDSSGPICFETPSHYEITVGGRKLVGSAQLRRKRGILQHGSLPLGGDLSRICEALVYPDEVSRDAAKAAVRRRALTLAEALGRDVSWREAVDAVANGFAVTFGIDLVKEELSPEERAEADRLEREVYSSLAKPLREAR